MYCKNCGKEIPEGQELCDTCAQNVNAGAQNVNTNQTAQSNVNYQNTNYQNATVVNNNVNPQAKSKLCAGLLGIFLGAFGVHNFYLGFYGKAIAQLLISILSCGALAIVSQIWGLIEGIMILCGNMDVDANGVPLKD